ncbi:MAG: histidine ammonia-lyase [Proteobacteria bacterium]|nr:MAG: histidine ammonia-lyase [Pseudomonadota bacterium]
MGLTLDGSSLNLSSLRQWSYFPAGELKVSEKAKRKIKESQAYVGKRAAGKEAVYGVNTGFGLLSDVKIPKDKLEQLQLNLIRSHAVGVGNPLSIPEARAAMLLRTNTLAKGHSGCSLALIEKLLEVQNAGIVAWVPEQGSVGACGDLAPLAHMALVLIGEGQCYLDGKLMDSAAALKIAGIKPHRLIAKEGLSLINGTQVMTAIGALTLAEGLHLAKCADIAGALSLEAFRGTVKAFHPLVHAVRPHPEQIAVAANLRKLMGRSKIGESHKDCTKVQDPYSFRCMPQVHGASRRFLDNVVGILETEMNSATDNPLVFLDSDFKGLKGFKGEGPDGGEIVSGGNFHGQYVAMAMDTVAIALSEFANISDLRVQKLINPSISGLPAFLTRDPGLNSGMMIVQVASASLVSENKILSHPASVDSIPTSADKEDHVSMGVTAARKARQIMVNLRHVLAMEFLSASQGIDLLRPLRTSAALEAVQEEIRSVVPPIGDDRIFHHDIMAITQLLSEGKILAAAEGVLGELQ